MNRRIRTIAGFAGLCLIVIWSCSSEPFTRRGLENEFQVEYGFPPPPQITSLRCKTVVVGDSWSKWMLFTYDKTTVDKIISLGFTNATAKDLKEPWSALWSRDLTASTPNPNAPKWFQLPGDRPVQVFYKLGHPNDYAGYRYIWIDDIKKIVYAKNAAWH